MSTAKKKGLEINSNKTKYMALNPHKTFKQNIAVKGQKLEYVLNFNYLGITLDTNLSWKQQLKRSKLIQLQNSLPIIKMHGGSISKAASPALEVFKYKVQSSSLYGALTVKGVLNLGKIHLLEEY